MSEFSANKGLGRTAAICRDAPEYYQTGPRVTTCEIADPLEATQPMTAVQQLNAASRGYELHKGAKVTVKPSDPWAHDFRDNRPRGHLTQTERDVQDLDPWAGLDR